MRRTVGSLAMCIALASLVLGATPALAGGLVRTYPGTCPGTTLQDCIDASGPGDIIEIATNTPTGGAVLAETLTIRPATGFQPTIGGDLRISVDTSTMFISVLDLTIQGGVEVELLAGTGHVVGLRGLDVAATSGTALQAEINVPSSLSIVGGRFHTTAVERDVLHITEHHSAGLVDIDLIGNRISGEGNADSRTGLFLGIEGTAETSAGVYNNAVFDVARCDCSTFDGSMWLNVEYGPIADVDIVGNTFERSGNHGLVVRTLFDFVASLDVDLFDNILADAERRAVRMENTQGNDVELRAGHNDYFGNGLPNVMEGHSIGTDNLAVSPRYVDLANGDLRLKPTSALIDAGHVCSPGGIENRDAASHGRLSGPSVDIGAYERGAGAPTGIALVASDGPDLLIGTPQADIICGYGGADEIDAGSGRDYVDGGKAGDLIIGGNGPDRLIGFGGPDDICARDGVSGNDVLVGGNGIDGSRADSGDTRTGFERQGACPSP